MSEDILDQLLEGSDKTEWDEILKEWLYSINEAVFDGEIPVDRIKIKINDRGGKGHAGTAQRIGRQGRKLIYRITLYRKRLEQCSWKENIDTMEHECLHILLWEWGIEHTDKSKIFIYEAGKRNIVLNYSEYIK